MADANRESIYAVKETAWGETPDQTKVLKELPYISETLKGAKDVDEDETIRNDRQHLASIKVGERAEGGFVANLTAQNFEDILEGALLADSITTIDIDAETCTISAAGNTITADAGTPFTSMLNAGWVKVSGAAQSGNNGMKRVTNMTGSVITVGAGQMTNDETSVALDLDARWMQNGTTSHGLLVEKQFADISKKIHFTGMLVDTLGLTIPSNGKVQLTVGFMGEGPTFGFGGDQSASAGNGSPTAYTENPVFNTSSNVAEIAEDEVASVEAFSNFTLDIANNYRRRPKITSLTTQEPGKGTLRVTGNGTLYFTTGAQYAKYLAHTPSKIQFPFVDTNGKLIGITLFAVDYMDTNNDNPGRDNDIFLPVDIAAHKAAGATGKTIQIDMINV